MINPGTHIKIVVYYLQNGIGKGWVYSEKKEIKLKLAEKYGIHAGTLFNCTISEYDSHNQCYSIQDNSVKILPDTDGTVVIGTNSIKLKTNVLTHHSFPQGTLWSPDFDFVDYQDSTQLMMSMVYTTYVERMSITKHNNGAYNEIIFTVVEIPKESEDKLDYAEEFKEVARKIKEKQFFSSPAAYAGQKGFQELKGQPEANSKKKYSSGQSKKATDQVYTQIEKLKARADLEHKFLIVKDARGDPNYGEAFSLLCHSITVHNLRIDSTENSVEVGQWCEGTVKFDKQFYRSKRNLGFKVGRISKPITGPLKTFVKNGKVFVHVDLNLEKAQPIPQMKNHFVIRDEIALGDILIDPKLYTDAKSLCKKYLDDPPRVHAIVTYRNAYRDPTDFNMAWKVDELVDFMTPGYSFPQPENLLLSDSFMENDQYNSSLAESGEVVESDEDLESDGEETTRRLFFGEPSHFTNHSPVFNSSPQMAYKQPHQNSYQDQDREVYGNAGVTDRSHLSYQGIRQEPNRNTTRALVIADSHNPALVTTELSNGLIAYCCSQEDTSEHSCFIPFDQYSAALKVGGFFTCEAQRFDKSHLKESGCFWFALTETIQLYEFPSDRQPLINVVKGSVIMKTSIDRSKMYPNPDATLRVFTLHAGFVRSAQVVPFARTDVKLNMAVLLKKCPFEFIDCEVRYDYMSDSDEHCWRLVYITDSDVYKFTDDLLYLCSSVGTSDCFVHNNVTSTAFAIPASQKSDSVFVTDDELAVIWRSKELQQCVKTLCYELYGRLDDRLLYLRETGYDESINSDTETSRVNNSVNDSQYSMVDATREARDCRSGSYMHSSSNRCAREIDTPTQRTNNHGFKQQEFTDHRSSSRASSKFSQSSKEIRKYGEQTNGNVDPYGKQYQYIGNVNPPFTGVGPSQISSAPSQSEKKPASQQRIFDTNRRYGRRGWGVMPAVNKAEQSDGRRF